MVMSPWVIVGQTSRLLAGVEGAVGGAEVTLAGGESRHRGEEHRLPHHVHIFRGCVGDHQGDVGVQQRSRCIGAGGIAAAGAEYDGTSQGAATN